MFEVARALFYFCSTATQCGNSESGRLTRCHGVWLSSFRAVAILFSSGAIFGMSSGFLRQSEIVTFEDAAQVVFV